MLTPAVAFQNQLLNELLRVPAIESYLLPKFNVIPLTLNQVLYEHGDQTDYVYFPLDAVISKLAIMEDGTTLETAMVGRDGLIGMSAILGSHRSRHWAWVTVGGSAIQLESRFLDKVFVDNETAVKVLLRCYRSLITQISQRCVCNTRHTILERLACWLLMVHDRIDETAVNLTQEIIASRVGARRAGITVAAGILQDMNVIAYRRGRLQIENREALTQVVCECYSICKYPNSSLISVDASTPCAPILGLPSRSNSNPIKQLTKSNL